MKIKNVGLGAKQFELAIYIANRPPIDDYPKLSSLRGVAKGELQHITSNCSNHWRKVFNVYAKFLLALDNAMKGNEAVFSKRDITTWQHYRDNQLLQPNSREALLFSPPDLHRKNTVHIIAGKTYARDLALDVGLTWLDSYFAINKENSVIVSPYLDYRQLSNARIEQLAALVKARI